MNIIADRVVTDFDAECTLPFGNYFLLYNRLLIKIGIFILGKNMFLTDATLLMTIIILGLICFVITVIALKNCRRIMSKEPAHVRL